MEVSSLNHKSEFFHSNDIGPNPEEWPNISSGRYYNKSIKLKE